MTDRLARKRAVVTGAGSGIGRALALGLAREGARVAAIARTRETLDALAAEHPSIIPFTADVSNEASISVAIAQAAKAFGGLDTAICSAGIQLHGLDVAAHECPLEVWQQTIDINLTGVFLTCKHVLRAMLATGDGGSIINIGSPTGIVGTASEYTAYSSAKGGVHALTRVLAVEYATRNIRVNTLAPGATYTPLVHEYFDDPEKREFFVAGIPMKRVSEPEEHVGMAVHLASDESSYTTGALLLADGGQLAF
jgi:NAD(P)-dependent dehydrogenase (short-subunit alcohol dehydrogenase family)